jgi:L-lactate dehydrogenase complex protein LldF
MLVKLREELHHTPQQQSWLERFAYRTWARTLRSPFLYRLGTWLTTRTLGRWKSKSGWIKRLPGQLGGWTQSRDFPAPAPTRFRDWWEAEGK